MLLIPFLNDRQIGSTRKVRSFSYDYKPNLDFLLPRLACKQEDVYITHEQGYPAPPFSCKFRKDKEKDLLAVCNEEGDIYLIDTDGRKGILKEFRAHDNAIFDICWLPDQNRLVTGGGDFWCYLIDMSTSQRLSIYNAHTASIKCVDVCPGDNGSIFAAGSKDGNISVWDIREKGINSKPAIAIKFAHGRTYDTGKSKQLQIIKSGVSAVAFKDCYNLASAGVADSNIKIWDLRKTYVSKNDRRPNPRYKINFCDPYSESFGFTSLVFDSLYKKLYACSTSNTICQVDCHTYSKNNYAHYTGYKCSSYFVKIALSCDDQYLVCGSSNDKAYIWKTSKPGLPIYELPGHSQEVTSVAWGAYDNTKVVTCGDDMRVLVWKSKGLEDANDKHNEELVATACPYTNKDDTNNTRTHNVAISSINQSVTFMDSANPTPQKLLKTSPTSNSITHFFSPIITPQCPVNLGHNKVSPSGTPRLPLSPRKNLLSCNMAGSSTKSSPTSPGKENGGASSDCGLRLNGQLKRKLDLNDRSCKHHPEGCGRRRGLARCGKKIAVVPEKMNIKNYFSVSPD